MNDYLLGWSLIVVAALFNSYASLVVKLRFNELGKLNIRSPKQSFFYILNFVKSPLVISAIITFILAPLAWLFALKIFELSIVYPVQFGLHLIFVLLLSLLFLGEKMNLRKLIGVISVFLSLYFFSTSISNF